MNENILPNIAEELAKKVNKVLNLPIINEQQEQVFYEMVILLLLELLINKLGIDIDLNG
ncbi:MAG: hypothetical protein WC179_00460 [Candidatus Cloacimonadaceae bacterium]|jgi:hypothetical protein|nr:hypothetical protein [Candidatus Cloacimonadota bacterium]MDD5624773.1 hypothetical protein [Candidatus Cloacimonadota bacterium]MDY0112397.1 hypothetical protein [Candidatus Syntrophosphaera sp.]